MIGFERILDPMISFDGTEETAIQVNLSVTVSRGEKVEKRVLLDIAHPFIRELAKNKDQRLFELLEELVPYALRELEKPHDSEDGTLIEVKQNRPGYVYLVKSGDGYYKIGCSKDVKLRTKSFGLQLPFPFEVVHIIPAKDMFQGERSLQKRYAHRHLNGEWFALTEEEVQAICSTKEL